MKLRVITDQRDTFEANSGTELLQAMCHKYMYYGKGLPPGSEEVYNWAAHVSKRASAIGTILVEMTDPLNWLMSMLSNGFIHSLQISDPGRMKSMEPSRGVWQSMLGSPPHQNHKAEEG